MVEYFRADRYGDWNEEAIPPRDLKSVYHPEWLIRDLIGDVQIYLNSKKIYTDLGISYRRGYLLAGPPGIGKSTLILAGRFALQTADLFGAPARDRDDW